MCHRHRPTYWAGLSWAGLSWAGLSWAGLSWAGLSWAGRGLAGLRLAWLDLAGLNWAYGARIPLGFPPPLSGPPPKKQVLNRAPPFLGARGRGGRLSAVAVTAL